MKFQSSAHWTSRLISLLALLTLACASQRPTVSLNSALEHAPRPPAEAAVVAAHPLASEAGLAILEAGGSAADAAIAALAVLNVVEPHASGLGGGGFALTHFPDSGASVIDYREYAPQGMMVETFFDPADTLHLRRQSGGSAVAVPAAWAGWAHLHNKQGRLPLAHLLKPAIQLAREGYPVSGTLATLIQERIDLFMSDPALGALFLVDGFPPMEGDILFNTELALLFEELASQGFEAFPELCGEAIASAVQAAGGWIQKSDLLDYKVIEREPLSYQWKKWTLLGPPPPAGALTVLEALAILEPIDLAAQTEPQRLHLLAESLKKAMRDKGKRMADPAFHVTPIDSLLDPALTAMILQQIYPDAIHQSWPPLGSKPIWQGELQDHGNTTHLSILAADGSAISLTQSINFFFGAGVVARGLLLNNQMNDFTFVDGSLNFPEAKKRPRSNMAPMMMMQEDEIMLCIGTPGGSRIPSAMTQILVNHLLLGQPIQEAIDSPRFHPVGSTFVFEPRLASSTLDALEEIGYRLYPMGPFDKYFGGAHGIARLDSPYAVDPKRFSRVGTQPGLLPAPHIRLQGGADPRRDGRIAKTLMHP
jgi:gamma-glutamyltranspeptidase / glutathione hydrolase